MQGGGHIVEGQGQFLHFLAGILVDFHPGVQLAVTEGRRRLGKLLEGLTLPPGEGHDPQHGDKHHEYGYGEKNIGDFIQNLLRAGGGCGHDDDAQPLLAADDGGGHHIAFLVVEVADGAGGAVAAVFVDLVEEILIELPTVVGTAVQGAGAEGNVAVVVADHKVGVGDLGYYVQIQHQVPAGEISVHAVGACQIGDHLRILGQPGNGGVLQKAVDLNLEGRAENGQRQQQDSGSHGEITAEGAFHRRGHLFLSYHKMYGFIIA